MNIFDLRNKLIHDYALFVSSFVKIRDSQIWQFVEEQFASGALWPDPLLQLNPSFKYGATIDNPDETPVNDGETKLKLLLETAGFMAGKFQQQIRFKEPINAGCIIGSTTPDVSFAGDPDDPDDKGICIYLDGLSAGSHGNPYVVEKDILIRNWLRNNGYQVISISYVELDDRKAMVRHFRKLARYLSGRGMAARISEDTSWMDT